MVTAASSRPRDVVFAGVLTIMGSVLALAGIFSVQGELRSSRMRRDVETRLDEAQFAIDISVDTVLNLMEIGLMAASAASVAAIVLAVFIMRGHNASRVALSVLGGLAALVALLSGLAGLAIAVFVVYTVSLLWRAPVRTWFAHVSGSGPGADPRPEPEPGGTPGSRPDVGPDAGPRWPGDAARPGDAAQPGEAHQPGEAPQSGETGQAQDPRWPRPGAADDPARPAAQPGPYPQPWPPDSASAGPESPESTGAGSPGVEGQASDRGPAGPQGPAHPAQPGASWSQGPSQPDPDHPHPGQQPPPYPPPPGYGTPPPYPQGQGHGPPDYGYGYPPGYYGYGYPPGDPNRRPAQVVAAHVMTWIGSAFGVMTGVFFIIAAGSQEIIDLVREQLAAEDFDEGQFATMLRVAGALSAVWSLAVVVVSVFSWRRANWAAILLTVMGAGYLVVQLITMVTGQPAVLFTIVWVAVVLVLLWWPASRQWYAGGRRAGQYGPPGGAPYQQQPPPQQPPKPRNGPW